MTSERVGQGDTIQRRLPAAIIVALAAPILIYFIIRTAAAGVSPVAATVMPPYEYAPAMRPLLLATANPSFEITDPMVTIARDAAIAAPLAYQPYALAGARAAADGDQAQAIALLEQARRLRPSFLLTRLKLAELYGRNGRYPELLDELDYTIRFSEQARQPALPELAKMVRIPDGRRALAPLLASDPPWRADFYRVLAAQSLPPEALSDLMTLVGRAAPDRDLTPERGLYLAALVGAGRQAEAREAWLKAFPASEQPRHALLFDGAFRGLTAQPPFGWRHQDSEFGRAETRISGNQPYLEATYFGGREAVLTEQLLALAPGRYRLSFQAKSEGGMTSGSLLWFVRCDETAAQLTRIPVTDSGPNYRRYQVEFAVPASDCESQTIVLRGEPGDVSMVFDAQIANLQLVRL